MIRELASLLEQKGYRILRYRDFFRMRRLKRFLLSLLYIFVMNIKELRCLWNATKWIVAMRPLSDLDRSVFRTLVRSSLMRNFMVKREKPDMFLWEGEMHLLTILERMPMIKEKELCCFLNTMSHRRAVLIVLNVSRVTALERVLEDQYSGNHYRFGRTRVGRKEVERTLDFMKRNQDRVLLAVRKYAPGVRILELDGDRNAKDTAGEITTFLSQE